MQIVINISEQIKATLNDENQWTALLMAELKDIINNGTPLPKGHGKLIVEPTEEDITKTIGGQNDFAECIRDSVRAVFDNADAIIEADKGDSMESLSQDIIEHAKRIYPKSVSHVGRLTDKQFYEIEKECDIDFYKLIDQDIIYTIRYKGEWEDKE